MSEETSEVKIEAASSSAAAAPESSAMDASQGDEGRIEEGVLIGAGTISKPGQKYATPAPGNGDRVFYESLLEQNPASQIAQEYCVHYGVLDESQATKLLALIMKRKGTSTLAKSPVKASAPSPVKAVKAAPVKKKATAKDAKKTTKKDESRKAKSTKKAPAKKK